MIESEKVSVVIPTYKNRGALSRSIESVLSQSYNNIEVIVVDDNSTDSPERYDTSQLMEQFSTDPRVIYIQHEENKNGAAARNTGISNSKGKYIAFLDDDDIFLPNKIQLQVLFLQNNPQFDAVYCWASRNGERYGQNTYEGDATKELLLLNTSMFTPTLMFRSESLRTINGFDESFRRHQDFDLLLRFFHAGYKIGCVHEVLCEIGINAGENILYGTKLEEMKSYFFQKFSYYIDSIDKDNPGFRNRVYAKHYAGVFLSHIKSHNYTRAFHTFRDFFILSPKEFMGVIYNSLIQHIK